MAASSRWPLARAGQFVEKAMSDPQVVHDFGRVDYESPGNRSYQLAFHLDSSWGYSLVPLTVIRGGSGNAPGVAVFGGTHGNEFEGQIAAKRLAAEIDARTMAGLVIVMPQLSESACRAGTRSSPVDHVNMNRAFPGHPHGSISYRIAHFVTSQVFPRVQICIDIHSGGREAAFPLCASFHRVADKQQFAAMARTARLFDTPYLFVYSRGMASGLLSDQAEDEGKITIGGEFGWGDGVSAEGVRHAHIGSLNVMRSYGLLEGPVQPVGGVPRRQRLVEASNLEDYRPCPVDGVWEPAIAPGDDVDEGALIGWLHRRADWNAEPMEVRSHRAGVLIARFGGAVCTSGTTLFVVGDETDMPV